MRSRPPRVRSRGGVPRKATPCAPRPALAFWRRVSRTTGPHRPRNEGRALTDAPPPPSPPHTRTPRTQRPRAWEQTRQRAGAPSPPPRPVACARADVFACAVEIRTGRCEGCAWTNFGCSSAHDPAPRGRRPASALPRWRRGTPCSGAMGLGRGSNRAGAWRLPASPSPAAQLCA